jgi:hypothetical protein
MAFGKAAISASLHFAKISLHFPKLQGGDRRVFPMRPSSLSVSGRGRRPISGLSLRGKKFGIRREVSRCYLCPFSLIRVSRRSVTGSRLLDMVSSNPMGMPLGSNDRSNGGSRNEEDRSRGPLPPRKSPITGQQ